MQRLTGKTDRNQTSLSGLIDQLEPAAPDAALALTRALLDEGKLQLVGGRSVEEIAGRLAEKAADRVEPRLNPQDAARIGKYLRIDAPLTQVAVELKAVADGLGEPMASAVESFFYAGSACCRRRNSIPAGSGSMPSSGGIWNITPAACSRLKPIQPMVLFRWQAVAATTIFWAISVRLPRFPLSAAPFTRSGLLAAVAGQT